ncbi:hypothetical protein DSO57_1017265 [Entomophthora muscae]|uniref:Uncharacterized protein n=1 Tax=Entomophthora muscae TaxID=34485 RepID=A0ACC2UE50_9FUNG|nr:hypothetical protein DSO57_1017265 [Entomophthora muscae]
MIEGGGSSWEGMEFGCLMHPTSYHRTNTRNQLREKRLKDFNDDYLFKDLDASKMQIPDDVLQQETMYVPCEKTEPLDTYRLIDKKPTRIKQEPISSSPKIPFNFPYTNMVIDKTPTNNLSLNTMIDSDWKTKISETSKKLTDVLFTRKLWTREAITTKIYIARFPYLKSKLEDWQKNKTTDFIETLTPGTQEDTATETETCPKNLKPTRNIEKSLSIQLALSMNKDYGMYGFVLALLAQRPPLEGDSVMASHDIVALENHVLKAWIDKATSCCQKATLMISLGTLD